MWSRACVCGDLECTLYIYFPCIREIWRLVHPRKVIFPEGNARGKYDYFEGEQIFLFHSNIYSTDIEIWLVETIPRHIYQNIVFSLSTTPEGNMTISRVNTFSYLPYAREMNILFHQANVLVNSEVSFKLPSWFCDFGII
jgi:hypothetical protein